MNLTYFHLLLAMVEGPKHGYGMMQEIGRRTDGRVELGPSSLYYSLTRLVDAGLIRECPVDDSVDAPHEERRRYYELTVEGRSRLASESADLADVVAYARALGIVAGSG